MRVEPISRNKYQKIKESEISEIDYLPTSEKHRPPDPVDKCPHPDSVVEYKTKNYFRLVTFDSTAAYYTFS